ncbi:MAG: Protein YciE, partial [uncultured Acetobacteraceae bacterium]
GHQPTRHLHHRPRQRARVGESGRQHPQPPNRTARELPRDVGPDPAAHRRVEGPGAAARRDPAIPRHQPLDVEGHGHLLRRQHGSDSARADAGRGDEEHLRQLRLRTFRDRGLPLAAGHGGTRRRQQQPHGAEAEPQRGDPHGEVDRGQPGRDDAEVRPTHGGRPAGRRL